MRQTGNQKLETRSRRRTSPIPTLSKEIRNQKPESRREKSSILISAFIFLICFATPAFASASPDKSPALEGKLLATAPGGPFLATDGRQVRLVAKLSFLLHTLEDKRLEDREVRLEGTVEPDGAFEVQKLFTVKGGKLFKVRYYCEICNIAAVEPGNCVCCQRPTELQEIPVSEVTKDTVTVP